MVPRADSVTRWVVKGLSGLTDIRARGATVSTGGSGGSGT